MKIVKKEWYFELLLAIGTAGIVTAWAAAYRPVIWKLAQQTLFFADLAGLRSLASTLGRPGGALDWFSRGAQVTGLGGAWRVVYPLAVAGTLFLWRTVFAKQKWGLGALLVLPAILLPLYPVFFSGTAVWMLTHYAAAFRNVFGLWIALGIFALARRTTPWIAALAATLLFPWCGYYPLIGAIAASVWCLPLALVPLAAAALLYHDLSPTITYLESGAILDHFRFCALNAWSCSAFLCLLAAAAIDRCDADPLAKGVAKVCSAIRAKMPSPLLKLNGPRFREGMGLLIGAALVAGFWLCRPKPDLRGQLARERAVVEGRWEDVLAVKPANGQALRMESAYRILALQRLDRLPEQLFDEPIWSLHETTQAQEDLMDGHELLFAYGLLLPARRTLFETMVTKSWMPRHFQILGDIALLFGENALAERNYRLLLRCPYYRGIAKARLALLGEPQPKLPPDLEPVAKLARALNVMLEENKVEFFDIGQNAEQLVYNHFVNVKNCDGPTAKFCLACMLLNKKHDTIAINMKLLNGIFGGPDRIPASLQQALLVSGKAPAGTVLPAIQEQGMRFRADAKNATSGHLGQELFLSRWASTYFFYHEFVY
ncbi:MAG: hypothetical protein J6334_01860 [Kiritimatiellae bacterium]|nr:hypothetical protein [Kiritimatiellia bacterium]